MQEISEDEELTKEEKILKLLADDYNKHELAEVLGYKNMDSVGKYMRRRGYVWDAM